MGALGPKVRQKHIITDKVNIIDTAPTLVGLMNIPVHHTWQGRAISQIFKPNDLEITQFDFSPSELDESSFIHSIL